MKCRNEPRRTLTKPIRTAAVPNSRGPELVQVILTLEYPEARDVYLCGDFNEWSPFSLPMIQRPDNGRWEKRVTLPFGRYQYKFLVDGEWIHDPAAAENVPNDRGSLNSVLEV